MKRVISARRWIASLSAFVFLFLIGMSSLMYIIDPYFQFRVRDNSYLLSARYVNGGLIKNYEYDTLIIGSSMTENFDMDLFREKVGASPLHVSLGGMSVEEMIELLSLSNEIGKADTYYACIDIWSLAAETSNNDNISYLISQNITSTIQYLFSHEAWFYSLPVCSALLLLKKIGVELPSSISKKMSIDYLGNWEDEYTFGEEEVLRNYWEGDYAVSEVNIDRMYDIAIEHIDELFQTIDQFNGSFYFFFPPYSGLFWCSKKEQIDTMIAIKRYFVEQAAIKGHHVFDFQGEDFISNLNYYRDTTHYCGAINDWMVECFSEEKHIISPEAFDQFAEKLKKNINTTFEKYSSIF